jgi:hypothetical protein
MRHPVTLTTFFSIFRKTFKRSLNGETVPAERTHPENASSRNSNGGGASASSVAPCELPLAAVLLSFRLQDCRSHGRKVFIRHQFARDSQDYFSW